MSYTRATKRCTITGIIHIAANHLPDCWGAACDYGSSMPRVNNVPTLAEVPTCIECIVADAAWWARIRETRAPGGP